MSRDDSIGPNSRRRALAFCGAVLLAYVGVVHDVVGSTLYPDGPEMFGGRAPWYAAGLALTVFGLLMSAATLGWLRLPLVPLAACAALGGGFFVAVDAILNEHFHFFAFTMVVAGAAIIVAVRRGDPPSTRSDAAKREGLTVEADH